ncbi:MAG: hypothetical protein GTO22_24895, partial [Gemmatimonadales bacterium]|nr:hypothetical protein [Gemmatimonadales bacterium]
EWYQGVPEGVYVAHEGDRCDVGDAYTTLGAPFDNPDGICLHPDGRVFVGDPGISVLWVIPSPGAPPEVLLDSLPAPCYALVAPPWFDGPDVDPGDLLICDWAYPTGGLYAVDQDTLAAVRLAGPPDLEDGLHTAAFGPGGELYAMDTDYQERDGIRIVTISPSGDVTPIIDDYVVSPGTQQCGPLAVHPVTGKLYFCNSAATGTVYRSEPDGSAVEVFAAGAGSIASTGMAFNADGSALFVSDENSGMVVKITGTDLSPSASSPQIDDVLVDRGRDTDAPGWPVPSYHQRVTVRASDPDGASDIVSVTITDADGIDHTVHFYDYESWWEEDADTIRCEFPQWHLAAPPTPGMYVVRVVDTSENEDSLTTPVAPAVPES